MVKERKTEIDIDDIDNIDEASDDSVPDIKEETEELEESSTTRRKISSLVIVFVLFGVLLVSIIATGVYYSFKELSPVLEEKETIKEDVLLYTSFSIGTFFVPLDTHDAKEEQFLKVSIVTEIDDDTVRKELEEKKISIRRDIYNFFKKKRSDELYGKDKQKRLNEEVLQRINSSLETGKLRKILFTDFFIL